MLHKQPQYEQRCSTCDIAWHSVARDGTMKAFISLEGRYISFLISTSRLCGANAVRLNCSRWVDRCQLKACRVAQIPTLNRSQRRTQAGRGDGLHNHVLGCAWNQCAWTFQFWTDSAYLWVIVAGAVTWWVYCFMSLIIQFRPDVRVLICIHDVLREEQKMWISTFSLCSFRGIRCLMHFVQYIFVCSVYICCGSVYLYFCPVDVNVRMSWCIYMYIYTQSRIKFTTGSMS